MAAAVGGARAGAHPTGTAVADPLYGAALAAGVTVAASRASRLALLVVTAVAFAMSRSWLWIPAGVALIGAFAATFQRRGHRRWNAAVGALAAQAILRWPSTSFHGFTALVAGASVAVVALSGWSHCRRRTRRRLAIAAGAVVGVAVILTVPALLSAVLARGPVTTGIAIGRSSLDQVEAGQAPAARAPLATAAADLATARRETTGWWDAGAYLVPLVAEQQRALADGTRAGAHLTAVASAEAGRLDVQSLRYRGGRIDLAAVRALAGPVARLDAAAAGAQATMAGTRSEWLVGPIAHRLAGLDSQVVRARRTLDLAALGLRDGPAILGGQGTRRYFVAFMTPAETRGLGGFIGAYGVLTVTDGRLSLTASGRATQLVPAGATPRLVAPADYAARYGSFSPQTHFEDVTYSPDFPTVEQVMAGLYPQVGGQPIDGALVLDPYSLAALLHFTGPITVPGLAQPLTEADAADVLLRGQYLTYADAVDERHDLLQAALSAGFAKLTSETLPSPRTLSQVLDPMVRQGRLLFWSSHPSDQPLIDRLGLSGAFPRPGPGSDVLAVTVANAGNSKIDAYVHQSVTDAVRYDPGSGAVDATVTIRMRNDAPSTGLPAYVIGSYPGSGLPSGTSEMWVSLYSPLAVTDAATDGTPTGLSAPHPEDGVSAYSTYIQIPSGATTTLTVDLHGRVALGAYRLTTRLQPLANPQSLDVSVTAPAAWGAASVPARWTAGTAEVQSHQWSWRPAA